MSVRSRTTSSDADIFTLAANFLREGISASGLSGETDGGAPGPGGGGPPVEVPQQGPPIPPTGARIRIHKPGHVSHGQEGRFDKYHEHLVSHGSPCEVYLDRDQGRDHQYSDGETFWELSELRVVEADTLAYSGSGPTTFITNEPLPWNGPRRRGPRRKVAEHEGYLLGHPVDATQTGLIQIQVLDSTNLRVNAPSRILEQVEAYKFFEQFQFLLPRTPMLNIRVMESISSWWRNFAEEGDLLEIDCTSGFAKVTNLLTGNFYGLGCLGSIPTYTGIVG